MNCSHMNFQKQLTMGDNSEVLTPNSCRYELRSRVSIKRIYLSESDNLQGLFVNKYLCKE